MSRPAPTRGRTRGYVLDVPVDVLSWEDATESIFQWASEGESRAVCACNVHSVITARRDLQHAKAIEAADLVTPDGAPVAWMLRRLGHRRQARIDGPELMLVCCGRAIALRTKMFLYGGAPSTLRELERRLRKAFSGIDIVGAISPPYRELTAQEDEEVVAAINRSGARIVWVGLGCPKQEAWMIAHRGRINAVMIGVGAAFDFHAGAVRRAPPWMRRNGLEWLYRLVQDPRRLARRYLAGNSLFVLAVARELLLPGRRVRDA